MQPNVESLTLELSVRRIMKTPHWKSWESIMNSIMVLSSTKRFVIAYVRPSCHGISRKVPLPPQTTCLSFISHEVPDGPWTLGDAFHISQQMSA